MRSGVDGRSQTSPAEGRTQGKGPWVLVVAPQRQRGPARRREAEQQLEAAVRALGPQAANLGMSEAWRSVPSGWRCALARPGAVVAVTRELSDAAFPLRLAMGLGWGGGRGADYAVTASEKALAMARERGSWLVALGLDEADDAAVSSLFEMMGTLRGTWTARQQATVRAARGRLQREVAREFGVSPSVVSESLKAAFQLPLARAEEAAAEWLDARAGLARTSPSGPSLA